MRITDPPEYYVAFCNDNWTTFTAPDDHDFKTWTITKTATTMSLSCNGVEIANYTFSESTREECATKWSRDGVRLKFKGNDNASEEFRARPIGK